jgi:DNA-binding response OmpR family regulator
MKESVLKNKRILAVDDEPDVLTVLEEEIYDTCPGCRFDKAITYGGAVEKISTLAYDLVILDAMGSLGSDLLGLVMAQRCPVAILTVYALLPEAFRERIRTTGWTCLPREKLGEIVPRIENILRHGSSLKGNRSRRMWGPGGAGFESNWKKVGRDWSPWEKPPILPEIRPGLFW